MQSVIQNELDALSLYDLGLLDAPAEDDFDRITHAVTLALCVPVSLVSIIDGENERQFFKSQRGLQQPWSDLRETPFSHSFCQYVVVTGDALVVDDARHHDLVSCNLAIEDLGVEAYLGSPVTGPDGRAIGALCAIDTSPRRWNADEVTVMKTLGRTVSDLIAYKGALQVWERRNGAGGVLLAS